MPASGATYAPSPAAPASANAPSRRTNAAPQPDEHRAAVGPKEQIVGTHAAVYHTAAVEEVESRGDRPNPAADGHERLRALGDADRRRTAHDGLGRHPASRPRLDGKEPSVEDARERGVRRPGKRGEETKPRVRRRAVRHGREDAQGRVGAAGSGAASEDVGTRRIDRSVDVEAGDRSRRIGRTLAREPRGRDRGPLGSIGPLEQVFEAHRDRRRSVRRREVDPVTVAEREERDLRPVDVDAVAAFRRQDVLAVRLPDARVLAGDPQVPEAQIAARIPADPEGLVHDRNARRRLAEHDEPNGGHQFPNDPAG